jgi:rhodanese-related sulfurtransferase
MQFIVAACCISCAPAAETNVIHINAQQAQKLISDKKVVVLDIRTPEEFAAGHIAGATNINFRAADFENAFRQSQHAVATDVLQAGIQIHLPS